MSCCRKSYWRTTAFNPEVFRRSKQQPDDELIELVRWRNVGRSLRQKDSIPNTVLVGLQKAEGRKEAWRTVLKLLKSNDINSWGKVNEQGKDKKRKERLMMMQYSTRNTVLL